MKNRIISLHALAVLSGFTGVAMADVKLPSILSDHAVLQKADKVPIWGKAEPGEAVSVSLNGQTTQITAGQDGRWRVFLNLADAPAGPFEMIVQGKNTLTLRDVVVGEVWLGAGQSNMEQSMFAQNPEEASVAVNSMHREFIVEKRMSLDPEEEVGGFWVTVKPGETESMSAVGYFFGKALHREIQRPVGMIKAAWGGRAIESFISPASHDSVEAFRIARQTAMADQQATAKAFGEWLKATGRADRPTPNAAAFLAGDASPANGWEKVKDSGLVSDPALPKHGAVWFRKDITLTAEQARSPQYLYVGFKSADFFQVYVNGKLVEEENMEDFTRSAGLNSRIYLRPEDMHDGVNQLAMRVFAPRTPIHLAWAPFLNGVGYGGGWLAKAEFALPDLPKEPAPPRSPASLFNVGGAIFNGMIHPLTPYAIRGVVWYQGESNSRDAASYRKLLPLLIKDWRNLWGNDRLPFYYCQLANWNRKVTQPGESGWAELQEAQLKTLSVPDTGMAVLVDTGEWKDIHPRTKDIVGERLAKIALAKTYRKAIPCSGPIYDSLTIEGSKVRLHFKHVEGGLVAKELPAEYAVWRAKGETAPLVRNSPNSELEGFAICGEDRNWVWADAKIEDDTVLVSSSQVPAPIAVRYAWADNPTCNLYNQADLPTSPFRTDDFITAAESPQPPRKPAAVSPPTRSNPPAPPSVKPLAITPTPRTDNPGWMKIVERQAAAAKPGQWDLVLIGDSITAGWQSRAPAGIWAKHFPAYRTLNLGIAADKTENVLWRLGFPGTLDGYQPKLFVLMIGTNNTGHRFGTETADDTAQGVRAILDTLAAKSPGTKILLLAIFPRGEDIKRQRNDEVNQKIERFADNKRVFWLNLNDHFLRSDGTLSKQLFKDEKPYPIHLTEKGYEAWAQAMQQKIKELTK